MRRLTPSYVVTSVAIALASTAALAQLRIQAAPGANATASTTASSTAPQAGTTTSGPTVAAGGCTGTGGSTCTATTTAASGPTPGNAVPSETTPATAGGTVTTSGTGSTATAPVASSGATVSRPFTPDVVNNAAADAGSQNLGTVNPSGTNLGNTALVPGVTVGGTTGVAGAAGSVNANGERAGIVVANDATPPTPLFELTARQGAAREARRRARGEEPRVYGIAPRTDRDLTHQMPDDPIIRY